MSKEILYIVDTKKEYRGKVENTMPKPTENKHYEEELKITPVHYVNEHFEDYNTKKGGGLVALDFDTFYNKYEKPYIQSLQKPFEEISEESYWERLECLPPMRWTYDEKTGVSFFFISEAYTSHLHSCIVKYKGKYYEALRSRFDSAEKLVENILENVQ